MVNDRVHHQSSYLTGKIDSGSYSSCFGGLKMEDVWKVWKMVEFGCERKGEWSRGEDGLCNEIK